MFLFDGIVNDSVISKVNEDGNTYYGIDWDRVDTFRDGIDFRDPEGVAHAWAVVLTYLFMDYRYLYL